MLHCALLVLVSGQGLTDSASVLEKLRANLAGAKTLSFQVQATPVGSTLHTTYEVKAMKPNFYRVESSPWSFYSDGKLAWAYSAKEQNAIRLTGSKPIQLRAHAYGEMFYWPVGYHEMKSIEIPAADGFRMFFWPRGYSDNSEREVDVAAERFDGRTVLALTTKQREVPGLVVKVYLDPTTYWPVGSAQITGKSTLFFTYRKLRTDVPMKPVDFAWSPPTRSSRK